MILGNRQLGIGNFQRWALGDLVDNANRGVFAEWLVGQALDAIDAGEARREWTAFDLRYGEIKVEVKTTGLSQTWNRYERSKQEARHGSPPKCVVCLWVLLEQWAVTTVPGALRAVMGERT